MTLHRLQEILSVFARQNLYEGDFLRNRKEEEGEEEEEEEGGELEARF